MNLDDRRPTEILISMQASQAGEAQLLMPESAEALLIGSPSCGDRPLQRVGVGKWLRPAGCTVVKWSARLSDGDVTGTVAWAPGSSWSRRLGLWVLTGKLPWLREEHRLAAALEVSAARGRRTTNEKLRLSFDGAPIAIVVGSPVQTYKADGVSMLVYGDAPQGTRAIRLQKGVVSTWARWRRDVVYEPAAAPRQLKVGWLRPPPGSEPGMFASSGSHAILMQFVADSHAGNSSMPLATGIFLIGAHEVFHSLGGMPGTRPAWVNESWASYFAYRAARRYLSGAELAKASELVGSPSAQSLLHAQRGWDSEKNNAASVLVFYSKGARFWAAIDRVLTNSPNQSGRLAALIQRTRGMRGLDWGNPDLIGAYFDRYSSGRASLVISCYLIEASCNEAQPGLI